MTIIPIRKTPAKPTIDEIPVAGLQLMTAFFKLRDAGNRKKLIATAEQLVKEEARVPAKRPD